MASTICSCSFTALPKVAAMNFCRVSSGAQVFLPMKLLHRTRPSGRAVTPALPAIKRHPAHAEHPKIDLKHGQ